MTAAAPVPPVVLAPPGAAAELPVVVESPGLALARPAAVEVPVLGTGATGDALHAVLPALAPTVGRPVLLAARTLPPAGRRSGGPCAPLDAVPLAAESLGSV